MQNFIERNNSKIVNKEGINKRPYEKLEFDSNTLRYKNDNLSKKIKTDSPIGGEQMKARNEVLSKITKYEPEMYKEIINDRKHCLEAKAFISYLNSQAWKDDNENRKKEIEMKDTTRDILSNATFEKEEVKNEIKKDGFGKINNITKKNFNFEK